MGAHIPRCTGARNGPGGYREKGAWLDFPTRPRSLGRPPPPLDEALLNEYRRGMETLQTGELVGGLERYESGDWS